jgi:hypothetical protein
VDVAGVETASPAALKRRLPVFTSRSWRQGLATASAAHAGLGPSSLVLFDVSTLYFQTDTGDGFRESDFSKERRLEAEDHHRAAHRRRIDIRIQLPDNSILERPTSHGAEPRQSKVYSRIYAVVRRKWFLQVVPDLLIKHGRAVDRLRARWSQLRENPVKSITSERAQ